MMGYKNLSEEEFQQAIDKGSDRVVLDVRRPEEWAEGIVPGAVKMNIMDVDFGAQVDKLERGVEYYLYCRSGGRSARACEYMASQGFKQLYNLSGGMLAWKGPIE